MKFKKGFFRLIIMLSVLLLLFLIVCIIVLFPRNRDIDLVCYNEILSCDNLEKSNKNICLPSNDQFTQALQDSDYSRLSAILALNIREYKNNLKNPFERFDCSYTDEQISQYYIARLKNIFQEKKSLYITAALLYIGYLTLLFSIWWICLGFVEEKNKKN